MAVKLSPVLQDTQFKNDGTLASGYKIITRVAGSSTPLPTYTTEAGNVAHSNPIILNSRGEPPNEIWLTEGQAYDLILTTDADVVVRTFEKISGTNDVAALLDVGQYVSSGVLATFISATSFSLQGDQTTNFEVGRALKLLTSGGTVYAKAKSSAFSVGTTTIVIEKNTGNLDSGLTGTSPSYGLISNTNNALPSSIDYAIQNQLANSAVTTGTASALSFALSPALQTPNAARQAASLTFHVALTGGAVTLQAAGQAALPLVNQNGTNPTYPINYIARVESNGTQWVITNPASSTIDIPPFTVVANTPSNGVTITLPAGSEDFRSATLNDGTPVIRTNSSAVSTIISSGSTGGATNNVVSRIAVLAVDTGTGFVPAWRNIADGVSLDETGFVTTVAEGGAGGADSATTIYATAAHTNRPYRLLGYYDETQTTAGTHSTAITKVASVNSEVDLYSTYKSAAQTITTGGLLTLAHGLGYIPTTFKLRLRNTTTEAGWAVNDETPIGFGDYNNGRHVGIYADVQNVYVRYGSSANVFSVAHKTTGTSTLLTNTSWNLLIEASR